VTAELAKARAGHVLVPGLLAAALLLAAVLGALRWLLTGVAPASGGVGAVAGGVVLDLVVAACVAALFLAGACFALFAALRRVRLK
jgi:hypothetical protein